MTAAVRATPALRTAPALRATGALATLLGTGVLLLRPALATRAGWTPLTVTAVFGAVMVLGLATPVDAPAPLRPARAVPARTVATALAGGLAVFTVGWLAAGGRSPYHPTALLITLNSLAAVAEEALFRRVAFAALLPAGQLAAIGGSALLFGLAHATVYGWWAVPLDTAAGLILGWQRWASGTWLVPAFTHAFADLLVVI